MNFRRKKVNTELFILCKTLLLTRFTIYQCDWETL